MMVRAVLGVLVVGEEVEVVEAEEEIVVAMERVTSIVKSATRNRVAGVTMVGEADIGEAEVEGMIERAV